MELRSEQAGNIDLIRAEMQAMIDSCNIQKNVNMTIKDGLKKLKTLVAVIERDQKIACEKEDRYQDGLAVTEELRQDRKKIREKLQAQVMRNVVLASNEASKRKRPSMEESSPENRPFKKTAPGHASKSSGRTPPPKKQREEKSTTKSLKDKKMISSVLIKVSQGKTYADVLGKLRKEVNPDVSGSRVVSVRATQKGDVLILLDKGLNKKGFTAEVRRVVEGLGEVRADPKSTFPGFSLPGNPILTSDLDSSSNFTSIIMVNIFFLFFPLLYNRENTRCKNDEKPMFAGTGANPLAKNELLAFLHLVFPRLYQTEKK